MYFRKNKVMIGVCIGGLLLIIILVAATITGSQSACESSEDRVKHQTNIDSKDMETNAINIYKHWKERYNATPQGAAGVLGALQLESRLDPKATNSRSGATGLCQWLGDRLVNLAKLAQSQGKIINDLGVQLDYLDQELDGAYKKYQKCLREKDIHQATKDWTLGFEGLRDNPDQWYLQQRQGYADHWFSVLGTNDPVTKNVMENASEGEQFQLRCGIDSNLDENDIIKIAKHYKGWFYYNQTHPSQDLGDLNNPNKNGGTDCSGFVWLVLNKAGYRVPTNMQWFTGTMAADARIEHKYLKEVNKNEAKAGDIVIVNQGSGMGSNGHTAFLLEGWQGNDTKIIQEGGRYDRESVNEDKFGTSFTNLLKSGEVVFARPIKK